MNENQFNNNMQSNNNMNQFNGGMQPSQPQYNGYNQQNNVPSGNNKMMYIIIGVVAVALIAVVLFFTVFKKDKDDNNYKDYDDYVKEQVKEEQKEKETLNKNFSIKDYKTKDGILVELKNDNKVSVDADIKIEFYDENGTVVNVEDGYMFDVQAKGKSYEEIRVDDEKEYKTYKVIAKLEKGLNEKTYNDNIEIVSNSKIDDEIILQVKNNSDVELDVELGLIFIAANNAIIDYEYVSISDIAAGETVSEKEYVPYDFNTDRYINYEKIDIVVISAVK